MRDPFQFSDNYASVGVSGSHSDHCLSSSRTPLRHFQEMSRCWVQAFSHSRHRRVTRKAEKYASVLMRAQSAILPALTPFFRSVTTRLGCDAPLT